MFSDLALNIISKDSHRIKILLNKYKNFYPPSFALK